MLSISCLEQFLHVGVGTFRVKLNVSCLLVLHDHAHAFAGAVELKDVQYFEA